MDHAWATSSILSLHQAILEGAGMLECESRILWTMAQLVSLSPYYLLRVFGAEVGMPPYAYLESVRIWHTQRLIKAG